MKPAGKPDAGNRHVRFDERGGETGRCRMAQATAPLLDSTRMAGICALRLAGTRSRLAALRAHDRLPPGCGPQSLREAKRSITARKLPAA
jgi:hypothetical protein